MAEFGNGLTEESLLDSDPGHPELEDPGVGDEEPGLEEGEAAIEDPVSEGHCFSCERYMVRAHTNIEPNLTQVSTVGKSRQSIW